MISTRRVEISESRLSFQNSLFKSQVYLCSACGIDVCGSKIQPRPARSLTPCLSTFPTLRRACLILLGLRSVLPQVEQFWLILYRECIAVKTSKFNPGTESDIDIVEALEASFPFLELPWVSRAARNAEQCIP